MRDVALRKPPRVAIITNGIPDYRLPVFKEVLDGGRFQLRFFLSSAPKYTSNSALKLLPIKFIAGLNIWFTSRHDKVNALQREQLPIPIGLLVDLVKFRPDIIIAGDFGLRSFICWMTAKLLSVPLVLWSEEIGSSARGRNKIQQRLRSFLLSRASAFLAWGEPALAYLQSMGVQDKNIFRCCQAVDNDFWISRSKQQNRETLRKQLSLRGTVFLLVGRLVQRKGFLNFLHAWRDIAPSLTEKCSAILVGDGEQESELRATAARSKIENVQFVGSLAPDELVKYYAACDALIFPSLEDVWGMVVNEALCCGLPVLASEHAGASQELVLGKSTGVTFDPANIKDFTQALEAWIANPPMVASDHCRAVVSKITQSKSADAINKMLDQLLKIDGAAPKSPLPT